MSLDEQVALALGWTRCKAYCPHKTWSNFSWHNPDGLGETEPPAYSTDIAASEELIKKMNAMDLVVIEARGSSLDLTEVYNDTELVFEVNGTVCENRCRAFLAVKATPVARYVAPPRP